MWNVRAAHAKHAQGLHVPGEGFDHPDAVQGVHVAAAAGHIQLLQAELDLRKVRQLQDIVKRALRQLGKVFHGANVGCGVGKSACSNGTSDSGCLRTL
jgi:hypothetical protein